MEKLNFINPKLDNFDKLKFKQESIRLKILVNNQFLSETRGDKIR